MKNIQFMIVHYCGGTSFTYKKSGKITFMSGNLKGRVTQKV